MKIAAHRLGNSAPEEGRSTYPYPQDLSALDDTELALRVRTGDEQAFQLLFQKHSRWVYGKIYRILLRHEDSEEVLLDVFMKVWTKVDRWSPDAGSFQAWLNEVAKNTIIDAIRKRDRIREMLPPGDEDTEQPWMRYEDTQPLPDIQVEHNEILRMIEDALQQVKRFHHRAAWGMRHLEGLSIAEIADVMQRKEGTIKIWIFRCTAELRHILQRNGLQWPS